MNSVNRHILIRTNSRTHLPRHNKYCGNCRCDMVRESSKIFYLEKRVQPICLPMAVWARIQCSITKWDKWKQEKRCNGLHLASILCILNSVLLSILSRIIDGEDCVFSWLWCSFLMSKLNDCMYRMLDFWTSTSDSSSKSVDHQDFARIHSSNIFLQLLLVDVSSPFDDLHALAIQLVGGAFGVEQRLTPLHTCLRRAQILQNLPGISDNFAYAVSSM